MCIRDRHTTFCSGGEWRDWYLLRQTEFPRSTAQGIVLDGHPSRYQPRPTGLNFGEQTGTGVFPLVIAVHKKRKCSNVSKKCQNKFDCLVNGCYSLNLPKCTNRLNSRWGLCLNYANSWLWTLSYSWIPIFNLVSLENGAMMFPKTSDPFIVRCTRSSLGENCYCYWNACDNIMLQYLKTTPDMFELVDIRWHLVIKTKSFHLLTFEQSIQIKLTNQHTTIEINLLLFKTTCLYVYSLLKTSL